MISLKTLTTAEMSQVRCLWEECFEDSPAFLDWYFKYRFQAKDGLGLFSDGLLLSSLHLSPRKIRIRKYTYPSAYLIALATKPAFRKQGLAKKLLTYALRHLAANNIFFTFLMPFNLQFYTRLGWGIYCQHEFYQIPYLTAEDPHPNLSLISSISDYHLLEKIYNKWEKKFNGALIRDKNDWECLLRDHFMDGGKVYVLSDKDLEPTAYALTLTKANKDKLFIRELAYTHLSFGKELLRQLSVDNPKNALIWIAPEESNPPSLFLPVKTLPIILGRITNLQKALEALIYPPIDFQTTLEVFDPLLPENNGIYQLDLKQGEMQVLKVTDANVKIRCSIGALARLIAGSALPGGKQLGNEIELISPDPELLFSLQTIFPKTTNYINEYF